MTRYIFLKVCAMLYLLHVTRCRTAGCSKLSIKLENDGDSFFEFSGSFGSSVLCGRGAVASLGRSGGNCQGVGPKK